MIRDDIKSAQIAAMKAGDKEARAAIGLIQAAIKNRDIEVRTAAQAPDDDSLVVEVLHLWTDRALRRKNRYYEVWVPVAPR